MKIVYLNNRLLMKTTSFGTRSADFWSKKLKKGCVTKNEQNQYYGAV